LLQFVIVAPQNLAESIFPECCPDLEPIGNVITHNRSVVVLRVVEAGFRRPELLPEVANIIDVREVVNLAQFVRREKSGVLNASSGWRNWAVGNDGNEVHANLVEVRV
jgi:hypothetical protein